ncbi:MAG: hypothetical protein FVQ82_11660 [Planctomycetes bacterium]|nr:hypothetical protein [Planctomycetota bacterium]
MITIKCKKCDHPIEAILMYVPQILRCKKCKECIIVPSIEQVEATKKNTNVKTTNQKTAQKNEFSSKAVAVKHEDTQSHKKFSEGYVECPKCDTDNVSGVMRCVNCNACLMPVLLGIITIMGLMGYIITAFLFLYEAIDELHDGDFPLGLILSIYYIACIVFVLMLRRGKYWAWIAHQTSLAMQLILITLAAPFCIKEIPEPFNFIIIVVSIISTMLIWAYIYFSKRTRNFCCA